MVAWVLVCTVVLILVMPPIALWLNLPTQWAGAWLGGVIDNTGAVIAAGEVLRNAQGEASKAAVSAAAMVKMAQNVMIGLVAFLLAIWATMSLERKEGAEKPSFMEVWYRFPKFVLGFMVASLVVSFIFEPALGNKAAKGIAKAAKNYRSWYFALCFVAIGLETNFKELVTVGGGQTGDRLLDLPGCKCRLDVVYFLDSMVRHILHTRYFARLMVLCIGEAFVKTPPL